MMNMWQCFAHLLLLSLFLSSAVTGNDIDEVVTVFEGEDAILRCPYSVYPEQVSRTLISWFREGQDLYESPEILLTMSPTFPEFNEEVNGKMRFDVVPPLHYWNMLIASTRYNDSGIYGCVLRYGYHTIESFTTLLNVRPSERVRVSNIPAEDQETIVYEAQIFDNTWIDTGVTLHCSFDVNNTQIYWVRVKDIQQELLVWGERRVSADDNYRADYESPRSLTLSIRSCCYNQEYAGDYVCVADGTRQMKLVHLQVLVPTTTTTTTTTRRWYPIRWEN